MFRLMVHTRDPLNHIALETLFQPCSDIALTIVPEVRTILNEALSSRPDVMLLSADRDVLASDLVAGLRTQLPETKVILWLNEISAEMAYQAVGSGIRGILRKNLPAHTIVTCVRQVNEGELWLERELTEKFLSVRPVVISKREDELITLVSRGLKNKEIASVMSITEGTVKVYVSRLFEKLGVRDRVELALFGLRNAHGIGPASRDSAPVHKSMFLMSQSPARMPSQREVTSSALFLYARGHQ